MHNFKNQIPSSKTTVVVVHGFGGKRLVMKWLASRLSRHYDVVNWGYNSFARSIEQHADALTQVLLGLNDHDTVHVVAHSMGSIVARASFASGLSPNLGRTVLLAPPNQGTPFATIAGKILGNLCTPVAQLSNKDQSFVNRLPTTLPIPVGIIAARYDLLVPLKNTVLASTPHHVVVRATHNSLLFSKTATELTLRFLNSGNFEAGIG